MRRLREATGAGLPTPFLIHVMRAGCGAPPAWQYTSPDQAGRATRACGRWLPPRKPHAVATADAGSAETGRQEREAGNDEGDTSGGAA
jgi:hypothetical protein